MIDNKNELTLKLEAIKEEKDTKLLPEIIKKDVEIFGVTGTLESLDTSDATATASDIADGKTAYVNGEKLIGTNKTLIEYTSVNNKFLFNNCIKKIDLRNMTLDNSVTSLERSFYDLAYLEEILIDENTFDTSNITNWGYAFGGCERLNNLYDIMTKLSTASASNINNMFYRCNSITKLPEIYAGNVINVSGVFMGGSWPYFDKFTDFGGFRDLGRAYTQKQVNYNQYTLSFASYCLKLTHESLVNVINCLYDLNLNTYLSVDGVCQYRQKLQLNTNQINMLTEEEKAIAYNKGWNIAS